MHVFTGRRIVAERSPVVVPFSRRQCPLVRAMICFRLTSLQCCLISRRHNATTQTLQFPSSLAAAMIASAPWLVLARPARLGPLGVSIVSQDLQGAATVRPSCRLYEHVPNASLSSILRAIGSVLARSRFHIWLRLRSPHSTTRPSNVCGGRRL